MPQSDVPGERAWPTQPFPTKPAPFAKQSFTVDDVNPWLLTPEQYQTHARSRREGAKRDRSAGRVVHSAGRRRRLDLDAGQSGRIELGHHGGESAEGHGVRRQRESGRAPEARGRHEARSRTGQGGDGSGRSARTSIRQNCQVCHGDELQGAVPGVPSLVGVTDRAWRDDAIRAVITGGRGLMRPVDRESRRDLTRWSRIHADQSRTRATAGAARRAPDRRCRQGPSWRAAARRCRQLPPRPRRSVVSRCWVATRATSRVPTDVDVPPSRYMSGLQRDGDVHEAAVHDVDGVRPEHRRDQVAGAERRSRTDDCAPAGPRTPAASARETASSSRRADSCSTRAATERSARTTRDTGKVLWTGAFTGNAPGVPVSYESKGRQYVVMISNVPGNDGQGAGTAGTAPSGMVAFALRKK